MVLYLSPNLEPFRSQHHMDWVSYSMFCQQGPLSLHFALGGRGTDTQRMREQQTLPEPKWNLSEFRLLPTELGGPKSFLLTVWKARNLKSGWQQGHIVVRAAFGVADYWFLVSSSARELNRLLRSPLLRDLTPCIQAALSQTHYLPQSLHQELGFQHVNFKGTKTFTPQQVALVFLNSAYLCGVKLSLQNLIW